MSSATALPSEDAAPLNRDQERRRRAARQRRILASGTDRLNRIRATFSGEEAAGGKSRPTSGRATPCSRPTTPIRELDTELATASIPIGREMPHAAMPDHGPESSDIPEATIHPRSRSTSVVNQRLPGDDQFLATETNSTGRLSRRPSMSEAMNDAIRSLSAQMMQPSLSARHIMDDHEFNMQHQPGTGPLREDWAGPDVPRSRRGSDASIILMQEVAAMNPLASFLPPELANLAAGGMPPFLPAEIIENMDSKRRRRQWQLLHFFSVLCLALAIASALFERLPAASTVCETDAKSTGSGWLASWFSGVPLFYMFLTLEIGLQSMRIMFDKRLSTRMIQLQARSSLFGKAMALAARYRLIWATSMRDFCVLLFIVGMAVVWSPSMSSESAASVAVGYSGMSGSCPYTSPTSVIAAIEQQHQQQPY